MTSATETADTTNGGNATRQHWRWTVMASMADYIDAGSIVAGGVGLSMWADTFHLSDTTVVVG